MKKMVITAKNINAMTEYHKYQIEKLKNEMTEKHKSEIQIIYGGLKILEFEYKKEIKRLMEISVVSNKEEFVIEGAKQFMDNLITTILNSKRESLSMNEVQDYMDDVLSCVQPELHTKWKDINKLTLENYELKSNIDNQKARIDDIIYKMKNLNRSDCEIIRDVIEDLQELLK